MEKLLMDILVNMEKEKEFYIELVELSTSKTDIILDKKLNDLEKVVGVEQEIIVHIGRLEVDRQELLEGLAQMKNIGSDSITLTNLIEWSEGEIKTRFENLQNEFNGIIDRQRQLNEINSKLIRTNLEYIDFALNLMTGEGASGHVYEKKGQVSKGNQSRNLFDTKA